MSSFPLSPSHIHPAVALLRAQWRREGGVGRLEKEREGAEPSVEGHVGLWWVDEDRNTEVDRMEGGSGRGGGTQDVGAGEGGQ